MSEQDRGRERERKGRRRTGRVGKGEERIGKERYCGENIWKVTWWREEQGCDSWGQSSIYFCSSQKRILSPGRRSVISLTVDNMIGYNSKKVIRFVWFYKVSHIYLKQVTSCNYWSLILISQFDLMKKFLEDHKTHFWVYLWLFTEMLDVLANHEEEDPCWLWAAIF